ncbi:NAD(P)/FAD-dependent oxidoreductase [Pseudaestuariivita atlantica]|uniref:Oxidoreductase n=1 Tax=Pseudaestuariivita atlantica TaxID=1317121 RepID=A0A0L1JTQ0_9RHOB|nr:FAD-dependent oxidoreductase [Pseudaestuariivita atlantica]KNG95062.1 oxidoreductase [Pseudaestuariivita atlantica]
MVDVTVKGAGVAGLSVAWACARRGARVRVIDPHGVAAGASGGIVGALAPHVPENWNDKKAFQLDSLLMAGCWWAEVARTGGRDPGYARTGRVQPLADAAAVDLARARADGAARLWRGEAAWCVTDAPGEFAPLSPTGLWVHDTLTARLHPRRACLALAAAIEAAGGEVVTEGALAGAVVEATGVAGLQALSAETGRAEGAGVKGQAALLAHDARHAPQLFVGGAHVVPHDDGTVAVGSTSERDYDDAEATDEQLDAVIAAAREAVPALAGAKVVARWAGVRPRAKSRAPLIGAHPVQKGRFIANGGFKIGFGMAPLCAEVLANLILDGVDRVPEAFRPRPVA